MIGPRRGVSEASLIKVVAAIAVVLLAVTLFMYSAYNATSASYKGLQARYSSLNSSYGSAISSYITLEGKYSSLSTAASSLNATALLSAAYAHWNGVAIENVSSIMSEYSPGASLHWIGGPLNGNYIGTANITAAWAKFTGMHEYILWYASAPPTASVDGSSAVVKAPLQYLVLPFPSSMSAAPAVDMLLNVNETLGYGYNATTSSWRITNETWQITKMSLTLNRSAPGYGALYYNKSLAG